METKERVLSLETSVGNFRTWAHEPQKKFIEEVVTFDWTPHQHHVQVFGFLEDATWRDQDGSLSKSTQPPKGIQDTDLR